MSAVSRSAANTVAVFCQTAELDQETADMFKEQLFSRIQLLEILQYTLLGVGSAAFLLCLVGFFVVRRNNRKQAEQSPLTHTF